MKFKTNTKTCKLKKIKKPNKHKQKSSVHEFKAFMKRKLKHESQEKRYHDSERQAAVDVAKRHIKLLIGIEHDILMLRTKEEPLTILEKKNLTQLFGKKCYQKEFIDFLQGKVEQNTY